MLMLLYGHHVPRRRVLAHGASEARRRRKEAVAEGGAEAETGTNQNGANHSDDGNYSRETRQESATRTAPRGIR